MAVDFSITKLNLYFYSNFNEFLDGWINVIIKKRKTGILTTIAGLSHGLDHGLEKMRLDKILDITCIPSKI